MFGPRPEDRCNFCHGQKRDANKTMITGDKNFSKSTSKSPESPVSPVSPMPSRTYAVGVRALTFEAAFRRQGDRALSDPPETPV